MTFLLFNQENRSVLVRLGEVFGLGDYRPGQAS